ncbi:MAG: YdcF family protein [Parcubacteria group bacterium]|nr:YdcF family protein [Parcubacteria group bacterium]
MEIGILVHGRHVQAEGWEKLVWGEPLAGDDIGAIVFGTGASEKEGLKESEYTKRFLLGNFDRLKQFTLIGEHPCFRVASPDWSTFKRALEDIICETESQNTFQEVENAAAIFAERNITHVIQISCSSHLPRCIVVQRQVREAGNIPPEQRWYAVADDATFGGVPIQKSVVILEAPHRGDDPMLHASLKPHEVIPGLFGLSVNERVYALAELRRIIEGLRG